MQTLSIPTLIDQCGGKEEALEYLQQSIKEGKIPFPFRSSYLPPSRILFQQLKDYPSQPRSDRYHLKSYYPRPRKGGRLYLPPLFERKFLYFVSQEADLDYLSDLYLEKSRLKTSRAGYPSVIDYWQDPKLRQGLLEKLFHPQFNPSRIITLPLLRELLYQATFESKPFRPTWGKSIICTLFPQSRGKGIKILDFSAGWGDRLLAAMATDSQYTGVDPNLDLKEGHQRMISDFGNSDRHRIIYQPFEEIEKEELEKFAPDGYDLILTSPPFFNLEIYPGPEETQSVSRFPTLLSWFQGFLFPSLKKAWDLLRSNGVMAIHLGDTKDLHLAEITNLFIEERLPRSSYLGTIGLSGKIGEARPIWIWKKTTEVISRWRDKIPRSFEQELDRLASKKLGLCPNFLEKRSIEKIKDNPPIILERIKDGEKNLLLVRDDYLPGGTKQRALIRYFRERKEEEFVYAGPDTGYGQVAVAVAAYAVGKKATLFLPNHTGITPLTRYAMKYGAKIQQLPKAKLSLVREAAERYIQKGPVLFEDKDGHLFQGKSALNLPFGLHSPELITLMAEQIKQALPLRVIEKPPNRVWLVVGSGTILEALAQIWLESEFLAIQVGREIRLETKDKVKHLTLFLAPEKFWNPAEILPPYPAVKTYDAKLWRFVQLHGQEGDLIWNVASDK